MEELGYMTSIICQNTECKESILHGLQKKNLICSKCREPVSAETWEEVSEISQFTEQQLDSMKDVAYLDVCRICLRKQENLFHKMNIHRVKVLDLAMESCIELGNWDSALEYGEQLVEPFRKYYGELHPLRGIFLMKLGKFALFLEKMDQAKRWFKEAASILLVTHGESHPLIREELFRYMQQCQSNNI